MYNHARIRTIVDSILSVNTSSNDCRYLPIAAIKCTSKSKYRGEGGERELSRLLVTNSKQFLACTQIAFVLNIVPPLFGYQHRNTISTEHCEQRQMNFPSSVLFLLLQISPDGPRTYSKKNFTNSHPLRFDPSR